MTQHWYHCHTCGMVDGVGCCSVCAKVCHKDCDVTYSKHGSFFCDCGAREDQSCIALRARLPLGEDHKRKTANKVVETDGASKTIKLQTNMSNFFQGPGQTFKPVVTQPRLDDAIVNFIVATNQANRVVEHPTFKHLVTLGMVNFQLL